MQECHRAHTSHTCMAKHTLATAGKESQACMWHSIPSSTSSTSSNIPLIGFWIHKMPPIRWGDCPSIPGHRPSLSPYFFFYFFLHLLLNRLLLLFPDSQKKKEDFSRSTCRTTCCQRSSLAQPDWLSGAHTHTHTHTHTRALLRNNPAG